MRAESYNSLAVTALEPASGLTRYVAMALLVVAGSAVTAIAAQFRLDLPFTPVPITGQTFAVLLVGAVLGSRLGGAALLAYWGEGAIGLPVFAGGTGGWGVITGPTGGYIVGFIIAAFVVGWLAERGFDRHPLSAALAMFVGNIVIYVVGLPWLDHFFPGMALEFGLYPFIVGDAGKLLLAASLVPMGWAALRYVPGYQLAVPEPREKTAFAKQLPPLPWLYIGAAALLALGAVLPWGAVGGGHDIGVTQAPGQVAIAAAVAAVALAIMPRIALALLAIALLVFGVLLPTGVLSDRFVFDEGDAWNIVALIAGLIGVAALAAIALPKMTAKEAMRIGQFAVGALAGAAGFFRIAGILNESADFAFADLGAGLVVAPLAAVLLVSLSLLSQDEGAAEEASAAR